MREHRLDFGYGKEPSWACMLPVSEREEFGTGADDLVLRALADTLNVLLAQIIKPEWPVVSRR